MPAEISPNRYRPDSWRHSRRIRERMQRVHGLHLRGLNATAIAARLGVSVATVSRDLDRHDALWQEQRHDFAERERLRSLGVIREFGRLLWPLLDRHRTDQQSTDVARLLRVFLAGQREIRLLLNAADPLPRRPAPLAPAGEGPLSVAELVASFSDEELGAVTPEQVAAWDAESDRDLAPLPDLAQEHPPGAAPSPLPGDRDAGEA